MITAINLKISKRKILFFVIIFLIFFCIFNYKNFLFGNNIIKNRSEKQMEQILSNMNNYNAEIHVTVISNKSENEYDIYQEIKENYSMQKITKGNDIEGIIIEKKDDKLVIKNAKLNLEKVYNNYEEVFNNSLFLDTFSVEYKDSENMSKMYEENGEIILELELKNNSNAYIKYKKLYLNPKTLLPVKLEIKDNTKNDRIRIIYNNIEKNKI